MTLGYQQSRSRGLISTLWFQLEDMFQIIVKPQVIKNVTIQLKDTPI